MVSGFPRDFTRVLHTTIITVKMPSVAPLVALASGILFSRIVGFQTVELWVCLPLFFAITWMALARSARIAYVCCLLTVASAERDVHGFSPARPAPGDRRQIAGNGPLSGCVVSPPAFYEGRDQFVMELAREGSRPGQLDRQRRRDTPESSLRRSGGGRGARAPNPQFPESRRFRLSELFGAER